MPEIKPEQHRRPLLFFKVGALGSAPRRFPELLAERFSAHLLSSDAIRALIKEERVEIQNPTRIDSQAINKRLGEMATPLLMQGHNVVEDIFCNNPKTRRRGPGFRL